MQMTNIPYLISVALLLLVAFVIGCLIGYFLRCILFKPAKTEPAKPTPKPAPAAAPASEKPSPQKATPSAAPASAAPDGKPVALNGPRDGKKDDLKRIKGIGPKIEGTLNELGIYHFDQISLWSKKTVKWVDNYLSFKGRIDREDWVKQAGLLAKGVETEFSKRVDKGAVPSSKKNTTKKASSKAKKK